MQWSKHTEDLIAAAIAEDLGDTGDVTSAILARPEEQVIARVVAREAGIAAGLALLPAICRAFGGRLGAVLTCDPATERAGAQRDGAAVRAGDAIATIRGPRAAVLAAERTILNFLGRMSGVATLTHDYVAAARRGNAAVQVLDTRKTIPGWRELDKYAVRCGGAGNHRQGLHDAVLIKDNHLAGLRPEGIAETLRLWLTRVADLPRRPEFIEVEVDTLAQLREVLRVEGVDIVLLDNFSCVDLRAAVELRDQVCTTGETPVPPGERGRPLLEASGGVTLATIEAIAATGVERISVGALTHSARSLDVGLDIA